MRGILKLQLIWMEASVGWEEIGVATDVNNYSWRFLGISRYFIFQWSLVCESGACVWGKTYKTVQLNERGASSLSLCCQAVWFYYGAVLVRVELPS